MPETASIQVTLLELTADIVAAHVSNNKVTVNDVANLVHNVHQALASISGGSSAPEEKAEPKVSIRASIKPDYIVCLEDGKKQKMLKRHLRTSHGMTPSEYRAKWGLPTDYPMVASNYAETRRTLAKASGLGTKGSGTRRAAKSKPVAS